MNVCKNIVFSIVVVIAAGNVYGMDNTGEDNFAFITNLVDDDKNFETLDIFSETMQTINNEFILLDQKLQVITQNEKLFVFKTKFQEAKDLVLERLSSHSANKELTKKTQNKLDNNEILKHLLQTQHLVIILEKRLQLIELQAALKENFFKYTQS